MEIPTTELYFFDCETSKAPISQAIVLYSPPREQHHYKLLIEIPTHQQQGPAFSPLLRVPAPNQDLTIVPVYQNLADTTAAANDHCPQAARSCSLKIQLQFLQDRYVVIAVELFQSDLVLERQTAIIDLAFSLLRFPLWRMLRDDMTASDDASWSHHETQGVLPAPRPQLLMAPPVIDSAFPLMRFPLWIPLDDVTDDASRSDNAQVTTLPRPLLLMASQEQMQQANDNDFELLTQDNDDDFPVVTNDDDDDDDDDHQDSDDERDDVFEQPIPTPLPSPPRRLGRMARKCYKHCCSLRPTYRA